MRFSRAISRSKQHAGPRTSALFSTSATSTATKTVQYRSLNPTTGALLKTFTHHPHSAVEKKLDASAAAFKNKFSILPFEERAKILNRASQILLDEVKTLSEIATIEMGKPIAASVAEVEKCALVCRYYSEHGEKLLQKEMVQSDASTSYIVHQPLGPILAIMPWNFPYWQVFRFAAPAIMAGNTCLLKHAPNVPQCAQLIESVISRASGDASLLQNFFVGDDAVGSMIDDARVQGVTLTGSVRAGQAVGCRAGRSIKKCVLELGGSDPFIVLKDADVDKAVAVAVASRINNNGQSCIASKRFIVETPLLNSFTQKMTEAFNKLTIGDPLKLETQLGPIARADLLDELAQLVDRSVAAGAVVLTGGSTHNDKQFPNGYFYLPTVLQVDPSNPAFQEETFGPVAAITEAKNEEEAIEIANNSKFGLGATVMSTNKEKAEQIALRINSGASFVNGMVKSDPRLPFGGIKQSGFGRELSRYGILEFVNTKTIWIA